MKSLVSVIVDGQQAGDTRHHISSYMGGPHDTRKPRGPKIVSTALATLPFVFSLTLAEKSQLPDIDRSGDGKSYLILSILGLASF